MTIPVNKNLNEKENIMSENKTEIIVIHLTDPVALGTTRKQVRVHISPASLAKTAKYLNEPAAAFSSNNEKASVNSEYYTLSQFDVWGHLEKTKKQALSVIVEWLNVDKVQQSLSGALTLPDELISKAVELAEEYTEKKEQEKKADEAARIEKNRAEAEKKEQAARDAEKIKAEKSAARETLAKEFSEMQKKQDSLTKDVEYWKNQAEKTEQKVRDAVVDEIIGDGYIERIEDAEVRYTVEED